MTLLTNRAVCMGTCCLTMRPAMPPTPIRTGVLLSVALVAAHAEAESAASIANGSLAEFDDPRIQTADKHFRPGQRPAVGIQNTAGIGENLVGRVCGFFEGRARLLGNGRRPQVIVGRPRSSFRCQG